MTDLTPTNLPPEKDGRVRRVARVLRRHTAVPMSEDVACLCGLRFIDSVAWADHVATHVLALPARVS